MQLLTATMAVNIYAAMQIDVSVFDEMYGAKDRGRGDYGLT